MSGFLDVDTSGEQIICCIDHAGRGSPVQRIHLCGTMGSGGVCAEVEEESKELRAVFLALDSVE
ncbi:hypothetical protein N0V87_008622 [Didymella glomerata]|uniref:Uncharacterized protein n=1 Tax=Didymella glomerata TaxID=749621 RepID=A0A9W9BXT0_9PLEO|nr:hypothetical protein N0V87_008622 [Didymella glomerata]